MTFHDLPWHSISYYDILSRPGLMSGPLQSSPAQINSHLTPRLVPIDSKSSYVMLFLFTLTEVDCHHDQRISPPWKSCCRYILIRCLFPFWFWTNLGCLDKKLFFTEIITIFAFHHFVASKILMQSHDLNDGLVEKSLINIDVVNNQSFILNKWGLTSSL